MQQVSNEIARQQVIKKCKEDLIYFGKIVSPKTFYLDSPPFHYELADILMNRSIKQTVIQAPRGTAKSSLSLMFALHHAVFDEGDKVIVMQSKTRQEAINRLTKIKDIVSYSEAFRAMFGYCGEQVAEMWREDKIKTKIGGNWVTIRALGTGQQIRGMLETDTRITLLCHAKGSLIWENGRLTPIELTEHIHLPERIDKIKQVGVYGVPIKENVTKEHRFWARQKTRWYSKNRNRHYKLEEAKWTELKDMKPTDYWIGEPIDYSDSNFEPIEVYTNRLAGNLGFYKKAIPKYFYDPEFWWAYGLWWGDGHTMKNMVGWSCADKYPAIKERLIKFISKYGSAQRTQRQGCEQILWCKTEVSKWLKSQSEGNAIKIPPLWVRQLPKEYLRQIIRGLIDSDGCVNNTEKNPMVRITSVNLEGLLIAQKILAKLDIPSWVRATTSPRWTQFEKHLSYSRQKYDIYFRNNVEQLGINIRPSTRYNLNSVFIENGYIWRQVKTIEHNGNAIIHPITTSDHTYLSAIGKNHNCLDDPDDEMNCATKEQMEKNFDAFFGGVAGLDMRNGRVIVIGTPIRELCIVDRLSGAQGWEIRHYQSVDEDTKEVLWKEMYSYEWLMNKKEELKSIGKLSKFYSEYQCQIMGEEDKTFRDWKTWDGTFEFKGELGFLVITKKNGLVLPEPEKIPVNFFVGIDPASSTKSSADYSVSFVVAYDANKNIYCLYYYRQRVSPLTHAEQIIDMIKSYKPRKGCVETIAYQEMLRQYLRQRLMEEGLYLSGLEQKWNPRTEKSARLETLQPFFASGKIWVKEGMNALEEELNMYPRGKNDDLLDGLYYATRLLYCPDHALPEKKSDIYMLPRERNEINQHYMWMR